MNAWQQQIASLTAGGKMQQHKCWRVIDATAAIAAAKDLAKSNSNKIVAAVKKNPGCSATWIKAETGLARETIRLHLLELQTAGILVRSALREWRVSC